MLFVLELSIHQLFGAVRSSEVGTDSNEAVARGATVVKQWSSEAVEGGGMATLHRGVKESRG